VEKVLVVDNNELNITIMSKSFIGANLREKIKRLIKE
jgi:hypothetical protein